MAIPLVAGPSGMAAVMLLGSNEPGRMGDWSLALLIAWARDRGRSCSRPPSSTSCSGTRVLTAVERLMGMLLVAISVQMFLDGRRGLPRQPAGAGWQSPCGRGTIRPALTRSRYCGAYKFVMSLLLNCR